MLSLGIVTVRFVKKTTEKALPDVYLFGLASPLVMNLEIQWLPYENCLQCLAKEENRLSQVLL